MNKIITSNLAQNLILKKTHLKIPLNKLAKLIGINYSILLKIIKDSNYIPSIKTLNKIANFLNIPIPDILKYNTLPQYLPKFNLKDYKNIINYLTQCINVPKTIFSEKYIHEKAFAIDFDVNILEEFSPSTFYFAPANNFTVGNKYLMKSKSISEDKFFFVEIIDQKFDEVVAKILPVFNLKKSTLKFSIQEVIILGIAVKQSLNINLV